MTLATTLATRLTLAAAATLATIAVLAGSYIGATNLALPMHFV